MPTWAIRVLRLGRRAGGGVGKAEGENEGANRAFRIPLLLRAWATPAWTAVRKAGTEVFVDGGEKKQVRRELGMDIVLVLSTLI